jgi:hypothetical protein
MDKAASAAKMSLDTQYQNAIKQKNKFTEGLYGKTGEKTEEAVSFDTQIEEILSGWGTRLNEEIYEIQQRGGSSDEIMKAKNKAVTQMNKFSGDIANWEAARQEYMIAKENGSLLSDPENQRNVELINMFEAATDDDLDNLYITHDENGSTRISLGTITDGVFDAQSTKDISAFAKAKGDQGDKGYFETKETFNAGGKEYELATNTFKKLESMDELKKGGVLNKKLVLDYLENDEIGQTLVSSYLATGDGINKWESLNPDASRPYSDEAYLDKILSNAWDDLYTPIIPPKGNVKNFNHSAPIPPTTPTTPIAGGLVGGPKGNIIAGGGTP